MSYDLELGVRVDGTDIITKIAEPTYYSPTYNLGPMFRACTGWDFVQGEWYRVSEVWPKIEHGISELRMYPKKYKKLEPDNGWGDTDSAIEALTSLSDCIAGYADHIPPDKIWVRW